MNFPTSAKYCATYEAALDRIAGMISANSPLTAQGAEINYSILILIFMFNKILIFFEKLTFCLEKISVRFHNHSCILKVYMYICLYALRVQIILRRIPIFYLSLSTNLPHTPWAVNLGSQTKSSSIICDTRSRIAFPISFINT